MLAVIAGAWGWMAGGTGGLGVATVAWADVERAVGNVEQFHLTAFVDDPRTQNADGFGIQRVDLFHTAPNLWRAHGMNHVEIIGRRRTHLYYDVVKQTWIDVKKSNTMIIPDDLVTEAQERGMMPAMLRLLFHGETPAREPVLSDTVATAAGIAVFDYAHDSAAQWARIWVLEDSQLPIRMKIYQPDDDAFTLVSFDYGDPQPASFFDPGPFRRAVHAIDSDDPYDIYPSGHAGRPGHQAPRRHPDQRRAGRLHRPHRPPDPFGPFRVPTTGVATPS